MYAYVIDSGIYYRHPEFGGRASLVYDAVGGSGSFYGDCHGHGTHVAGIIGSATYGVAKRVNLRGVRVLDCNNTGTASTVIAGVDWVRVHRIEPAVANISTSGGYSSALNTAVTNLSNSGVFVAVAAGNANQDACNFSPASATAATTVAASDVGDNRAYWFSNYGSCVDLYAPGVDIESTWLYDDTRFLEGTSMSAPHVTGVAALYKARYGNHTSSLIDSWLKNHATHNVIGGNPSGTPNRLLFSYDPTFSETAVFNTDLQAPKCRWVGRSCDSGPDLLLGRDTMTWGPEPNQPNTIHDSCADGTAGYFHYEESMDRLKVSTVDGTNFAPGNTVRIDATVWAWLGNPTEDYLDLYYTANANSPVWTYLTTIPATTQANPQTLSATYTLPTGTLQAVRAVFRYKGTASSCSPGGFDDHDDLVFAVYP